MSELLHLLRQHRIIVALRGLQADGLPAAARALRDAGIRMLEVTFDQTDPQGTEKTAEAIAALRRELGNTVLVGAGTVLTARQAGAAVSAGAAYLLSPNVDPEVLTAAQALGVEVIPGAFTPTEAVAAYHAGAAAVKLFPAGSLGLSYIKALAGPLGHIPLLPMGGVNLDNIGDFLAQPNVAGVGIGSAIAKPALVRAGDFDAVRELARSYVERARSFS